MLGSAGSNFGDRLRAWRAAAGLTQGQLGEKVGALQNTVSEWERSDERLPDPHKAAALDDALGLDAGTVERALHRAPNARERIPTQDERLARIEATLGDLEAAVAVLAAALDAYGRAARRSLPPGIAESLTRLAHPKRPPSD